ncbi:MAG: class I SAM-dependent methyltransferase [Spirochaetales bacterium]|nr:class I SAM-dependent methyltransferase [Spirochaetales bacterium]
MHEEKIFEQAKKRFGTYVHSPEYKIIHSDTEHLDNLLDLLPVKRGKQYLDLGTGNGYIAKALAEKYPDITVHGIDIAENAIDENNRINRMQNLSFETYNGLDVPYPDSLFYGVISRYAFHHFPDIERSITELNRIVETGGYIVFSDPGTDESDTAGFIDEFQKLVPDGHIHFYREKEIEELFHAFYFQKESAFYSSIRYPRNFGSDYESLVKKTDKKILENYKIKVEDKKIFVTVTVLNILFKKRKSLQG